MNRTVLSLLLGSVSVLALASRGAGAPPDQSSDQFVYASFEETKDGRPVSRNGGLVQLTSYAENQTLAGRFSSAAGSNPPAPELVHTSPNDPNHAVAFDYELLTPNNYCGVTLEVNGHELKDGKSAPDDLSAYKTLSVQAYATGVTGMRVEILSVGTGLTKGNDSPTVSGFPQKTFKVNQGLNTYKIALDSLKQPGWQQAFRVGAKDVLKQLTSVHLSVFCEGGCRPTKGQVVIDNIVFEK